MAAREVNIRQIDMGRKEARAQFDQLRRRLQQDGNVVTEAGRKRTMEVFGEPLTPREVVQRICEEVRGSGLQAVLHYTERFDQVKLVAAELRVADEDLAAAHDAVETSFLETIRRIRENVLRFQQAILHHDVKLDLPCGGFLRQRYVPLSRVGLCIPGGAAAYPSTLLMTAVPAQAAGVGEIAVVAPPTPFGAYNRHLLATCHELGITEVYRMGGAQAVAALAYGVAGVQGVEKIVGPGNQFVALAKKYVFGQVAIDSIAGPSEVVVLADDSARPDFTAADLIAQAEHAPGSAVLITWSESLWSATARHLTDQLVRLQRGDWARQSLEEFGALVLVGGVDEAVELANELASEHLHVATDDPERLLPRIRSAGAIFLGHFTPVAVGDYVAGPSHVLPTGMTARFASGLSANDFLRSGSVIHFTRSEIQRVAEDVRRMAQVEGLTAHASSIDVRLAQGDSP